jgi:hypothetical protein
MSRPESDREDLLAEGVNLPHRGRIRSDEHEWIVGWRAETAVSVFDGVDPVIQFNTSDQLRRVYLNGEKLAAHNRSLTRLARSNDSAGRMKMQGQPLSADEQAAVLQKIQQSLDGLQNALSLGKFQVETIGLTADEFVQHVQVWLASVDVANIAMSPNVVDSR